MSRAKYAFSALLGPWSVIAVIGLEVANLTQLGSPWRGEFMWTVDWMAIGWFIAGPVIAGMAAVDASRISRKGVLPVAAVMQRPHAPYAFALAWTCAPATIVHCLALIVALVIGAAVPQTGSELGLSLLAFLVQLGAIWWYAALGSAIGRFISPLAAGISATFVALGVFYTLSWGRGFLLLDFGAATVSRLGISLRWQYLLVQAGVLTATFLVLLWLPVRAPERRYDLGATGVVLILVFTALIVGTRIIGPTTRTELSAAKKPDNCFFVDPQVCLYRAHLRVADDTVASIVQLAEAARNNGYELLVPDIVHEQSWSYQPPAVEVRGIQMPSEILAGEDWDTLKLAQSLLVPTHCPQVFGDKPPSERYFLELEALTFTWIALVENPRSEELADIPPSAIEARALTPTKARDAKEFLDSCDF